jgi:anthranilate synthase component 1
LTQRVAIEAGFDLVDLHAAAPDRYPFLLESTAQGPQGRYDILFALPGERLELTRLESFDFLEALDERWRRHASRSDDGDLPFSGGWFLYLGYELAAQIETQLKLPSDRSRLPIASATRCPAAVIHDHGSGRRWIIAEHPECLPVIERDILAVAASAGGYPAFPGSRLEEDAPQAYLNAVERILRYIRDGDVFQVNLSRAWQGRWPAGIDSHVLYRRLRASNPGPYSGLATWGDSAVISSSPERLVDLRGDRLQTRPIAGTRPRGEGRRADRHLGDELLGHPKEQAEHIMLIDLERNDLGRVAMPGSVKVSELMVLESYATVHHIVSNVQAVKRRGVTPGQVIRAVFPGGTITGCPKVRCMEIIAELEQIGRGPYTGSMGYLNRDGSMELNILIRTLVRSGERIGFRAGAGIVADSIAERELEETRAKAAGMLAALVQQDGP